MRKTVNPEIAEGAKPVSTTSRALIPSKSKKNRERDIPFSLLFVYSVLYFIVTLSKTCKNKITAYL